MEHSDQGVSGGMRTQLVCTAALMPQHLEHVHGQAGLCGQSAHSDVEAMPGAALLVNLASSQGRYTLLHDLLPYQVDTVPDDKTGGT